jgi:hypothetical protein
VIPAEFEEAAYEAPLYNQLERGMTQLFTPGRVLEHQLGFDRGIYVAEEAVWETLGYSAPPPGFALGYYDWPLQFARSRPRVRLPRFRLNIFLQAKRSNYYLRRPRALTRFPEFSAPLWTFTITEHQQRLLENLDARAAGRAHIAYAAPVFHTRADLYSHTRLRSIVQHSTFPSVQALRGHKSWYYRVPGADGVANPDPERIQERSFIDRVNLLAADSPTAEGGELAGFDKIAEDVIGAVRDIEDLSDPGAAQYLDDLQTLDRLIDPYALRPTLRAYAQVRLFALQFRLTWLIHGGQR